MAHQSTKTSAVIALVPRRDDSQRFDMRDRIALLEWSAEPAHAVGIVRVAIAHAEPDGHGVGGGDYATFYRAGKEWAAWGLARAGAGYSVWETRRNRNLGTPATIAEALVLIAEAAAQVKASSTTKRQARRHLAKQADAAPNGAAIPGRRSATG